MDTDLARGWLSEAIPIVLQADLSPAKNSTSGIVQNHSGAYAFGASQELEPIFDSARAGTSIETFVRNLGTQRTTDILTSQVAPGLVSAVDAIARRLDPDAVVFSTHSETALHAYVDALRSVDVGTRVRYATAAIGADPNFGAAQILLLDAYAQAGSPKLPQAIASASVACGSFTPLDRARFDSLVARLQHANLSQQIAAANNVANLTPNDPDALAVLGSLRFLAGNRAGGETALDRGYSLSGNNPNIRRQLAVGLLEGKQFGRAESLFAKGATAEDVIGRAACLLLQKDKARADALVSALAAQLPDRGPLVKATWQVISGSASYKPLSVSDDPSTRAYNLFLKGDFANAANAWHSILNDSGQTDLRGRAMLASCLQHLGKSDEVASLQVEPFVPDLLGNQPYAAISFVEMRRVLHL